MIGLDEEGMRMMIEEVESTCLAKEDRDLEVRTTFTDEILRVRR